MHQCSGNALAVSMMAAVLAFAVANAIAANRVLLGNAYQMPLAESADAHTVNTLKELRHKAAKSGKVRVIVGVRVAFAPEGEMNNASVVQQRNEISKLQLAVLKKVPSLNQRSEKIKLFVNSPFMALEVNAAELETLAGLGEIVSIQEDQLEAPAAGIEVVIPGSK